jgi:signal transduction histidine kinase
MAAPPEDQERYEPRKWSVRAVAVVVLGALVLFLPLEIASPAPEPLRLRLVPYAAFGVCTLLLFLSSWFVPPARARGRVALLYGVGMMASALSYVWVVPRMALLVSNTLTALLVGGVVLAGWTVRRTAALAVAVLVAFTLVAVHAAGGFTPGLGSAVGALLLGCGVAVACASVLARMRGGLIRRHRELTDLSSRLMALHEEERGKLSRELHDGVGQSLTAVLSYLWLVEREVPEGMTELRQRVAETRRLASKTLAEIRELSQLLRPSVLDDYGLVPSLDAHVRAFGERQHLDTTFTAEELPERLGPAVETAIYRITQEALANVARHAHAHSVRVRLGIDGRELQLEVVDDGVGLDAPRNGNAPGMGLIGVRERVRALGGTMVLASERGTRLAVRLPLPPTRDALPSGDESL